MSGAALGAGALLWLDPNQGRRRRALTLQKLRHGAHTLRVGAEGGARDLAHRARGVALEARARLRRGGAVTDDEILEERVRAKLGHVCAHPGAITVRSHGDVVELTGPILRQDHERVVHAVRRIRGVQGVQDRLEDHTDPTGVPGMHGRPHLVDHDRFYGRWRPATRFVVSLGGGALVLASFLKKGPAPWWSRTLGAALLARSAINQSLRSLFAISGARMAADALEEASERTEAALPAAPAGDATPPGTSGR